MKNNHACKKRNEVLSRVKELFDRLNRLMFGGHEEKNTYCPRSRAVAQEVLAASAEISSCLHSLVFYLPEFTVNGKTESVAQIVAVPIAYFFLYIDEVVYAHFPELIPDRLKESGNYAASYNLGDAIIKREDMDELKTLLRNTFKRLRQASDSFVNP